VQGVVGPGCVADMFAEAMDAERYRPVIGQRTTDFAAVEAQDLEVVMDWLDLRGKLAVGWNKDDGMTAAAERKEGIATAGNVPF